jgi:hypothetical protein
MTPASETCVPVPGVTGLTPTRYIEVRRWILFLQERQPKKF